jgi:hypothetical protein
MNYCALDDAFPSTGGAPSPGCRDDDATRAARKEERRKARRCKGPAATYLSLDADRQQWGKGPDVPAMNASTGLTEHAPVTQSQEYFQDGVRNGFHDRKRTPAEQEEEDRKGNTDNDPMDRYLQEQVNCKYMKVAPQLSHNEAGAPSHGMNVAASKKGFFGAQGPDDDQFADYVPDQDNYQLTPDFRKAFEFAGVAKAGSSASLPNPSANMYWKPRTVSGAQTSFIDHLPPPGGKYHQAPSTAEVTMDQVMKRMDMLFARLDGMNSTSTPEQVTSEMLMFISSGIFVLFLMDLLVKKGSTLRF